MLAAACNPQQTFSWPADGIYSPTPAWAGALTFCLPPSSLFPAKNKLESIIQEEQCWANIYNRGPNGQTAGVTGFEDKKTKKN
jgi:hypothetical protein